MHKVLLVDDNKEIFVLVNQAIGSIVELYWSQTLSEAEVKFSRDDFSLVLLDIEMPDGNGIEFCTKLQAMNPKVPIFFLTSHSGLSEKVLGFSAGAEDYISKPFAPLELKARVEAKLRKIDLNQYNSDHLKWKEIMIDKSRQEVSIAKDEGFQKIDLTALEFKLLLYFATKAGNVIHRDEVLNYIWGEDVHVYARSVDTHVSKLRKKLGPMSYIIESVHGTGYRFSPT